MALPTGLDFPTEWSRGVPARAARDLALTLGISPLTKALATLEVRGRENATAPGTHIFAANHVSHLDTMLVLSALPHSVRKRTVVAAALDTFFLDSRKAIPTVLFFNAIPIERHKVNRRSAELAQKLLLEGWHLVIYPEGGRTTTGELMEFKAGAAYLSERTGASVVPTYIDGAGHLLGRRYAKADVYRRGSNSLRHHIIVAFGPPLLQLDGENMRRFGIRVQDAVADLGRRVSGDPDYGRRGAA